MERTTRHTQRTLHSGSLHPHTQSLCLRCPACTRVFTSPRLLPPPPLRLAFLVSRYQRDYVMYSDDEGASWTTISQTFPKMDEAQMTQLPNGSVLLNMRHQTSPQVGRGIAVSNDNGLTFGPTQFDKALVSPVCQASIVTFGNTTYFSNPASTRGRQDISVKRSTDNAVTWSSNYLVEAAPSAGYSCLVKGTVGDDEHGGILFESVNATIAFARFPVQW